MAKFISLRLLLSDASGFLPKRAIHLDSPIDSHQLIGKTTKREKAKYLTKAFTLLFLSLFVASQLSSPAIAEPENFANNQGQTHNENSANAILSAGHDLASTQMFNQHYDVAQVLSSLILSDLNLNSIIHSITVNNLNHDVDINLNNHSLDVNNNSVLTPAEAVAVKEVLSDGSQTLLLNSLGQAVGGTLTVSDLSGHPNNIDIPFGVTLIDNQANLSLTGNLANFGDIITSSSASNISANILFNGTSGQISSSNALTVSANALINLGSISSSNNLNIDSNVIYNAGLLASVNDNVNITTSGNSFITGTVNGNIEALNGSINITDNASSNASGDTLNFALGNYVSNSLNINSNSASIQGAIGNANGQENFNSNSGVSFVTSTKDMLIGNANIKGDPTFVNTSGDITINGAVNTNGNNLAIIAAGNINVASNSLASISTTGSNSNGGNLTMIAGVGSNVTGGTVNSTTIPTNGNPATSTVTVVLGATTGNTGGNIDLVTNNTLLSGNTVINTSGNGTGNTNGGSVTLLAQSNGNTGGQILTANTTTKYEILTGGTGTGTNGNVTLISTANVSSPTTGIEIGAINTTGGSGGNGNINLYTANPTAQTVTFDTTGTIGSGQTITANTGSLTPDNIVLNGNLTGSQANSGSTITIYSGQALVPNTSTLTANAIDITTTSGSIGSVTSNLNTATNSLSLTLNDANSGNAYINNTSANLAISGSSANATNSTLSVINSGSISTTNPIYFYNTSLTSTTSNVDLSGLFTSGNYSTIGGNFTVSAGENITASTITSSSLLNASNTTGYNLPGGTITLTAGTSSAGGDVNLSLISLQSNSGNLTVKATSGSSNSGSVGLDNIDTSGYGSAGANPSNNYIPDNGTNAGLVNINASSSVATGYIRAYGGGGGGGDGNTLSIASNGSNGGNGGDVSIISQASGITVAGDINTSGGGGGGGGGSNGTVGNGGNGGSAGAVTLNANGNAISLVGPILASGGGGGGAGNSIDGGGGGGAFGGGGGGGDYDGAGGGGGIYGGGGGSNSTAAGGGGGAGVGGAAGSSNATAGSFGIGGNGDGNGTSYGGNFGLGGQSDSPLYGGNVGQAGPATNNGTTNNGGLAGSAGAINITGSSLSTANSVSSYYNSAGFTGSSYANYTIASLGPNANVNINVSSGLPSANVSGIIASSDKLTITTAGNDIGTSTTSQIDINSPGFTVNTGTTSSTASAYLNDSYNGTVNIGGGANGNVIIGSAGTFALTMSNSTLGNINITSPLAIGSDTGSGSIYLTSSGNITQSSSSDTLTAGSIYLSANSNSTTVPVSIGSGLSNPLTIDSSNINITAGSGNTSDSAYISDSFAGVVNISGSNISVASGGVFALTLTNPLSSTGLDLIGNLAVGTVSSGGSIDLTTFGDAIISSNSSSNSITAQNINFSAQYGNIGNSTSQFNIAASNLTVNTFANAYLSDSNSVTLNSSTAGVLNLSVTGNLTQVANSNLIIGYGLALTASGNLSVGSPALMTVLAGNLSLVSTGGTITIGNNTLIADNGGTITIQAQSTSTGAISIGSNVGIIGSNTQSPSNNNEIYIAVGSLPTTGTNTTSPSNVSVKTQSNGNVYFGTSSITATAPTNNVTANTYNVVFNYGGTGTTTTISLGGTDNIVASKQILIPSLDLTNSIVTTNIINLQKAGEIGGSLIVNASGVATGGNIILNGLSDNLSLLTAEVIPNNVTLTLNNFNTANVVNIDLSNSSTTKQVIIDGTEQFIGSPTVPSNGLIDVGNINLPTTSTLFNLGSGGKLTSDGNLIMLIDGNTVLSGSLSVANNLDLVTLPGSTGSITLSGSITSSGTTGSVGIESAGSIAQVSASTGTIIATTVNIFSSLGNIGSANQSILLATANLYVSSAANAYLQNTGSVNLGQGVSNLAGNNDVFTLVDLANSSGNGQITLNSLINVSGSLGTINLSASSSGTGNGGIQEGSNITGIIEANSVNLTSNGTSTKSLANDIGSSSNSLLTQVSSLNLYSTGNVYISNTGSLTIGNSNKANTAGANDVFNIATVADANGNGQIILGGNINVSGGSGQISLNSTSSNSGIGGIIEASSKVSTLTANSVYLTDTGTGNLSTTVADFGSSSSNILTATSNLELASTGNAYITNIGSVNLISPTSFSVNNLYLTTQANSAGNGQIIIDGSINVASNAILTSTSSGTGIGGIQQITSNNPLLTAQNIVLSDLGTGSGSASSQDIGSNTNNLSLFTQNLTVQTSGNSYLTNQGSETLNASQVGSGKVFSLINTPDNDYGNGEVLINGNITATNGTIILTSQTNGYNGGIQETSANAGTLIANTVKLSDTTNTTGYNNIDIGGATTPILVNAANLSVNNYTGDLGSIIGYANVKDSANFTLLNSAISGILNLTGGGSITAATASQVSGYAGLYVNANNALSLNSVSSANSNVNLTSSNSSVIINNSVSALNQVNISASTNINLNSITSTTNDINLTAANGSITAGLGSTVNGYTGVIETAHTGLTAASVLSTTGQINLSTNTGALKVLANSTIESTSSTITLNEISTTNGSINLGSNVTISGLTTSSPVNNNEVIIAIGTIPTTGTNTTAPGNITVNKYNSGLAYFGANGISATSPTNTINVNGLNVLFNGSSTTTAITLGGSDVINAGLQTVINSLDLTQSSVTTNILSLQTSGILGGTLTVNGSGVATGGNIIANPLFVNLSNLTAENIPSGVTLELSNFTLLTNITVNLSSASTTGSATINGTQEFISTNGGSVGNIDVNSTSSFNPSLTIGTGGKLTSDGSLNVQINDNDTSTSNTNGFANNGSVISSDNISISTNSSISTNISNIYNNGSITSTNGSVDLNANLDNAITQSTGTTALITANSVNFTSYKGNIGSGTTSMSIDTGNLSVNSQATVFINDTASSTLNLNASNLGSSAFNLTAAGSINVNGAIDFNNNSGSIVGTLNLTANNNGNITETAFNSSYLITAATTTFTTNGGNIGSSSNPVYLFSDNLSFNTGGKTGSVNVNTTGS